MAGLVEGRLETEAAFLLGVQERREHRRRIEVRKAHEVDAAVEGDEGDGPEVADDAVVLDGSISHPGRFLRSRVVAAAT